MSTVLWESERTYAGEQENISMFSTCSQLSPRAPIQDGRMERIMQPWSGIYKKYAFKLCVWNSEMLLQPICSSVCWWVSWPGCPSQPHCSSCSCLLVSCLYSYCFNYRTVQEYFVVAIVVVVFVVFADVDVVVAEKVNLEIICPFYPSHHHIWIFKCNVIPKCWFMHTS